MGGCDGGDVPIDRGDQGSSEAHGLGRSPVTHLLEDGDLLVRQAGPAADLGHEGTELDAILGLHRQMLSCRERGGT
jgi:hypothetical protein